MHMKDKINRGTEKNKQDFTIKHILIVYTFHIFPKQYFNFRDLLKTDKS